MTRDGDDQSAIADVRVRIGDGQALAVDLAIGQHGQLDDLDLATSGIGCSFQAATADGEAVMFGIVTVGAPLPEHAPWLDEHGDQVDMAIGVAIVDGKGQPHNRMHT